MEKLATIEINNYGDFIIAWNRLIELQSILSDKTNNGMEINLLIRAILDAEFAAVDEQIDIIRLCKDSLSHPQSIEYTKFNTPKQGTSDDLYVCRHQLGYN